MGIIKITEDLANVGSFEFVDLKLSKKEADKATKSDYHPDDKEKAVLDMIKKHFVLGYQTMYKPRREFNDMSVIGRMMIDQMSFNTYQPNNGEPAPGDLINGWRSNAVRPIVRNKCISIAAHATARLLFPKIFAVDKLNKPDEEAAKIMEALMEWSGDQCDYTKTSLNAVIAALVKPASIIYTEYGEVYRNVKEKKDGESGWTVKTIIDEDFSGFQDEVIPVDQFYIENIYEQDVQKQGWLIMRKVVSYSTALARYGKLDNFKYVKPGVLTIYSDANASFYETYDSNLRQEEVEEVIYWNKTLDVKLVVLNGVLVTDCDNPNPRKDKQYPFVKFGYELIDSGKFFYYKSLAFKLQQDANIINTLYPMVIDGTYLSVFSPMINYGSETIGAEVLVPGAVTTLSDPNSKLDQMSVGRTDTGWATLEKIEESLNESSQDPMQQGLETKGSATAYEISKIEQNAATVLGLFLKMIGEFVKNYGKLRMGDIIQYMTIPEVDAISGDLAYKSFFVPGTKNKRIMFDKSIPDDEIPYSEYMNMSYDILDEQGGPRSNEEIYKVNPKLWRELKYKVMVTPDVLLPRSQDVERAMKLEIFDRAIQLGQSVDQEKLAKDFLFGAYDFIKDPDEYVVKQPMQQQMPPNMQTESPTNPAVNTSAASMV